MRKTIGLLAGAGALALSMAAPVSATADDDGARVIPRVMVIGDSVTQGGDGDHTWRYFAARSLGHSVDLVGPHRGTFAEDDTFGGDYADPAFDQDHASRWGLSMWETLYWNSESAPDVTSLMANDPQVIVEVLGFNDMMGVNQTPGQTIGHVREFVARARAIDPGVDVVLASLPQRWFDEVGEFNAMLPALAAELSNVDSRVVVAPRADLELGVDTYDAAHPTVSGQEKIAAAVLAGLSRLGIDPPEPAPEPPGEVEVGTGDETVPPPAPVPPVPVPDPEVVAEVIAPPAEVVLPVAPARPRGVTAVRSGEVVRVRWRAVADAGSYRVRCGTSGSTTGRTTARVRSLARRCTVRSVNAVGSSAPRRVRVSPPGRPRPRPAAATPPGSGRSPRPGPGAPPCCP